jgi:uncharacterized protein with FMN-binding domain
MIKILALIAFIMLMAVITILVYGYTKTPVIGGFVDNERIKDGIYEGSYTGWPVSASVQVTIRDKKIVNIEVVKHFSWRGKKAESIIPRRIIELQSTRVDAVTGATKSSNVIMNAVEMAIKDVY